LTAAGNDSVRIGIDLTALLPQTTGVDVSMLGFTRALTKNDSRNQYWLFVNFEDRHRINKLPENFRVVPVSLRPRFLRLISQQVFLPILSALFKLDVLHSPSFILPLAGFGCKQVLTVHDLTAFSNPEWHIPLRGSLPYRAVVTFSIRRADAVLVPSLHVKETVLELIRGIRPEKVQVVPWGIGPRFREYNKDEILNAVKELDLPEKYILSVGTVEPRKNLSSLIRAYDSLMDHSDRDEHLVFAGSAGWGIEEFLEIISTSRHADKIRYLGYVPGRILPLLYAGARLFVYPSFKEGFGFPPLEAMSTGTPTIASDSSSMSENLASAARLVPPGDVEALAQSMREILSDDALRADLARRGLERAKGFTWKRTAESTKDAYRAVVDSVPRNGKVHPKEKLLFLHIPKTGGTTLSFVLSDYLEERLTFNVREAASGGPKYSRHNGTKQEFMDLSEEERANFYFVLGHFPFGLHQYVPGSCRYITLLRDPIERILSQYQQYLRGIQKAGCEESMSLEEFFKEKPANLKNFQTRLLCGWDFKRWSDQDNLQRAKQNLLAHFAVVGVTERFDETLIVLAKLFGWPVKGYVRRNVSKSRLGVDDVCPELMRRMIDSNQLDYQLHAFANELLDTKLSELGADSSAEMKLLSNGKGNDSLKAVAKRMLRSILG
jgi:glycosyltransferase involved in cell wall biosynthesis